MNYMKVIRAKVRWQFLKFAYNIGIGEVELNKFASKLIKSMNVKKESSISQNKLNLKI